MPGIQKVKIDIVSERLDGEIFSNDEQEAKDQYELANISFDFIDGIFISSSKVAILIWDLSVNCLMLGKNGHELIPQYNGTLTVEEIKTQIGRKQTDINPLCLIDDSLMTRVYMRMRAGWSVRIYTRDEEEFYMHIDDKTDGICLITKENWDLRTTSMDRRHINVKVSFSTSNVIKTMKLFRSDSAATYAGADEDCNVDEETDDDDDDKTE
jgi:hypothetical protein